MAAALLLTCGCTSPSDSGTVSGETVSAHIKAIDAEGNDLVDRTVEVGKGTNALEAMEKAALVRYDVYVGMGAFVTAINNISAGSGEYWALYVDGNYADRAIDAYVLNADTNILWKMEKLSEFAG